MAISLALAAGRGKHYAEKSAAILSLWTLPHLVTLR